jgi:hypothetical protein
MSAITTINGTPNNQRNPCREKSLLRAGCEHRPAAQSRRIDWLSAVIVLIGAKLNAEIEHPDGN